MTLNESETTKISVQAPAAVGASPQSWLMIACLFLFYVFSFIDRTTIAMIIDPIRADLDLTDTQVSLLIGLAFGLAYSIGGLPMSWFVDRYPRRIIVYFAVTSWGLATASCGLSHTFGQLFLARLGVGLGEAPLHPASHSMISDAFPRNQLATAISIYSMGAVIGVGLALVVGGWVVETILALPPMRVPIVGEIKPWQMVFIVIGMPSVALAFLIFAFKEPPRRGRIKGQAHKTASWGELLVFLKRRWVVFTCFTLAFGGMQVVNGAFIWWQPAYLSRFFKMSPAEYGLALGLVSAGAGVAGMILSGTIVDWLYSKGYKDAHMRYYFWAVIISTPFTLIALLAENVWVYFGLIWITKLLLLNFLGFSSALIQLVTPNELRGRMSAIFVNLVLAFSATAFGPLVPALISDYVLHDDIRLGRALAILVVIFVPIALAALWIGRPYLVKAVEEAETWR